MFSVILKTVSTSNYKEGCVGRYMEDKYTATFALQIVDYRPGGGETTTSQGIGMEKRFPDETTVDKDDMEEEDSSCHQINVGKINWKKVRRSCGGMDGLLVGWFVE